MLPLVEREIPSSCNLASINIILKYCRFDDLHDLVSLIVKVCFPVIMCTSYIVSQIKHFSYIEYFFGRMKMMFPYLYRRVVGKLYEMVIVNIFNKCNDMICSYKSCGLSVVDSYFIWR